MSITYENYLNLEEEMISNMLEESDRIRDMLDDSKKKVRALSIKEKKLILSELKDIEDIRFSDGANSTEIVFHFKPISLYLDPGTRSGNPGERKLPFYYLWKLGFIDFKTSRSKVSLKISNNSSTNFHSTYVNDRKRNFHDWGLNCWGGWKSIIDGLIRDKKYYDAVLHIASRMKQATVNDGISSYEKMCEFEYETKPYILLNDQEAEFFETEIRWLTKPHGLVQYTTSGAFQQDTVNNVYYMDLIFKGNTYRLALSNETYNRIQEEEEEEEGR